MQFLRPLKTFNKSSLKIKTTESKQKTVGVKSYCTLYKPFHQIIFKTNAKCDKNSGFGDKEV